MTLTQLGYIVAVANHRSFGLAAKKCHVTQPTLSMQIQKLEETLGVIIFDRSKQPVVTTPLGQQLVEQARTVLREAERMNEIIRSESGQIRGHFRLGIIPTVAPYLLPRFLRGFLKHYPEVSLAVEELETATIAQRLKDDTLDAGILATPLFDTGISENHLYDEPFYVCLPKQSPLAAKKELKETDLPIGEILLLNEGHCLRDQMISLCQLRMKSETMPERLHFESGSLWTLIRLVEQGSGFTIVPHLALDSVPLDHCIVRPFVKPQPVREIGLVVHRSYVKLNILEALKLEIQNALPLELQASSRQSNRRVDFQWKP